jgi:signal transduction histidine kinase
LTQEPRGISTRLMLVTALVLVIASITASSLLVIGNRMHRQVLEDFSKDLVHSIETFRSFESQRLAALQREDALLADLPSLRALMTTNDQRTIEDGAEDFWKVSESDLFALASNDGRILAAYTTGPAANAQLRSDLDKAFNNGDEHYLLSGGRLFEYSARPLYFGNETTGTVLGYVISGYAIDASFLRQVNRSSAAGIVFVSGAHVVTSTLDPSLNDALDGRPEMFDASHGTPATISLYDKRYLATADDLSQEASAPLQLVVMESFAQAEQSQHEINRLLVLVGLFALLAGTILMLAISGMLTGPLEQLAKSVRAFGANDNASFHPQGGPREVRELSRAFAAMREEIQQTNRALLESERLATIGRMASSVSHDLRHYLAAVYANAEFLASSNLTADERAELFADIRMAVHGTTELIDSLLIFSRTNGAAQRTVESISGLVERAIALVRAHPDAERVRLRAVYEDASATTALVDAKQMERAIYNLLLNACQAVRGSCGSPGVTAVIASCDKFLTVTITDEGLGVSETIRDSLFEPFVSAGKQNGTGLGLTLAQCVAEEHGGSVQLVSSRPGETVFVLSIARATFNKESLESPVEVTR